MAIEHEKLLAEAKARHDPYPQERFSGRGIVICAGGRKYFKCAWVCINMLRRLGCDLPIEAWHLGPEEMTEQMKSLLAPLGVEFVDAWEVRKEYPVRRLNGWELKPYALIHSRFQEMLLLDADNMAVRNPDYLFDAQKYRETGSVFWPDYLRLAPSRPIWKICGVEYRDEPEFESGQILIDKARCWHALQLAMHLNEHSDYYYHYMHGDKETFHMAWRGVDQRYAMPSKGIRPLEGTMCQHDFEGRVVFQHRNMRKWTLGTNPRVPGFWGEDQCLELLDELRAKWLPASIATLSPVERELYEQVMRQRHYVYVRIGHDARPMELLSNLDIGRGSASLERSWAVKVSADSNVKLLLEGEHGVIGELTSASDGTFVGRWIKRERMPILLCPIQAPKGRT